MMTPSKTDKRCTVKGGCGCFSLSFHDRDITYRGTVPYLIFGTQAHSLARIEEHVGTIPKASSVLSSLSHQIRALPESLGAMSRPRRERADLQATNPSAWLKRFGGILTTVPPRPRRLYRVALFVALLALMASAGLGARAADPPDARVFLATLTDRVIEQLMAPGIGQDEQEGRFRVLLNEGFNIPMLGRFVLGRYWRRASDKERKAFLVVFEDVIVQRFLPIFAENSGERLSIGQIRPDPKNPALSTVTSRLLRPQGEPVRVEWRIRREADQYRIIDVVAEGVSIAITLRSEYSSFIRQHGGDVGVLIESLRQKIAAGAFSPKTGENGGLQ